MQNNPIEISGPDLCVYQIPSNTIQRLTRDKLKLNFHYGDHFNRSCSTKCKVKFTSKSSKSKETNVTGLVNFEFNCNNKIIEISNLAQMFLYKLKFC